MSILNSLIKVGNLEIKNRLVMPSMATSKATVEGQVTEQVCDYYYEKSFGGYIGLIITEQTMSVIISAKIHMSGYQLVWLKKPLRGMA